jgi:hypothetical protein
MAKNLKLNDLTYGVLNAVEDSSYDKSFDRRRTDALTYLQTVISDYYTPDTLEKYDTFRGIVVKIIPAVPRAILADPQGKVDVLATDDSIFSGITEFLNKTFKSTTAIYKVYIPELEMRPAPTSLNDPVIDTYYDVLLSDDYGTVSNLGNPDVGHIVTVRFTDLNSFYDPRIISKGKKYNIIFDESSGTKDAHNNNIPSRRTSGGHSAAGAPASDTGPPFEGPTPNADLLRSTILTLNYEEKGEEISNGGDITADMAKYGIAVLEKIKEMYPNIKVRVTGGNDKYHQSLDYNSRHKEGKALDLTISPDSQQNINNILKILQGFSAGDSNFRFLNEYKDPTKAATGKHFHISYRTGGTEGSGNLREAQKLANEGKIETFNA